MIPRPLRVATLLLLARLALPADALDFKSPERYELSADQSLSNELWLVTTEANLAGTFEDDLFVAGNRLILAGLFRGDVWAAGSEVIFGGRAERHARLAGKAVTITGSVKGNLIAAGKTVQLESSSRVEGDAVLMAENLVADGELTGKARLYATRVTLGGRVGGDVILQADDIVVRPGTEIKGDLVYTSSRDLILDQRVALGGQLIREEPAEASVSWPRLSWRETASLQIAFFTAAMCVALPFLLAFSGYAGRSVRILRASVWKCLLTGVLAFGLLPMASVAAFFTIIGIPLSLLLAVWYALMLYTSKFIIALALGGHLLRRRGPQPFGRALGALLVGLATLYALTMVPLLGGAVSLMSLWLGLGAMILALFITDVPVPPPLPQPLDTFPRNDEPTTPAPGAP